ncbi:MAG: TIGR04211 family SH3 domain-containing protein [Methylobacter sp.]|nr:TIGR04211 family SH3 domain-containing protein [Methylobacter sp.]
MKKILISFYVLIVVFGSAQAETVYVTDNVNLSLRSEPNNQSKVLKLLPTGTPLTVINENRKGGFTQVRLENGTVGYIQTRNTVKEPPGRFQLDSANKNLALLQAENASLKADLAKLKSSFIPGTSIEKSLAEERDQLSRELSELKKNSSNTLQLKNERDELQERVVNVERDLQQFKLENQALKDSSKQDWFLYGGVLSLAGVLLGFILPKIGWRRKSSGWDSF